MKKIPALHVCPECGGKKYRTSKLCYNCHRNSLGTKSHRTHHRKDSCPQCGKPKLKSSKLCFSCSTGRFLETLPGLADRKKATAREPNFASIADAWMYYFVGLFMGEGTVRFHKNKGGTLSVTMNMKLRADDAPVIMDIWQKLGGGYGIHNSHPSTSSNPTADWRLCTQETVWQLLNLMLPYLEVTPAKKAREIDLALEFLRWRQAQPFHGLDRARCQEFYERMRDLRVYKGPVMD